MSATSLRNLFLHSVAQTSPSPIGLEIVKASGVYLYGADGKQYFDAISGFNVANIGHSNPKVVQAVQDQAAQYMHLIVYGEFIQQPQVAYAQLLTQNLPGTLNCVYFTNSGTEATEGALKLAKRVTGKTNIIAFNNAYHGSTQGALSVMGSEYWRNAYRPLLPGTEHYPFGSKEAIEAINQHTAAVIVEVVQAEAGIKAGHKNWLQALQEACAQHCCLLIVDEIQSGFGRTGTLWAFEQFGIVPDVLLLGKALGGGMPLGAFIASQQLMSTLTHNPVLGHITTFGGHPVSCAAGKAALEVLLESNWLETMPQKIAFVKKRLQHPTIKAVHQCGLWFAIEFDSFNTNHLVIQRCIANGLITDWFLFAPECLRFAPPLCSTHQELQEMVDILLSSL
jgi:acetylornithine/N-succinyldiaminopimelate aminotransferase